MQDLLTVSFIAACIVAAVRKLAPRIDGVPLVLGAAAIAGAIVASALQWGPLVLAWLEANPAVGVPVLGAVSGFVALGGVELVRSIVGGVTIDARGSGT